MSEAQDQDLRQAHLERLQQMPIFGGVSEAALGFLLDGAQRVEVPQGEFFFREREPGTSMFVLESGRVCLLKSRSGEQEVLGELGPGDCFGEMALIDLHPRSASVRSLAPCTAVELPSQLLYRLYERDQEQFTLIVLNLARELSRRLRDTDERLFEHGLHAPGAAGPLRT
jgi:CRP/FNR family cyclic AMP-dependent transcriptional regulator